MVSLGIKCANLKAKILNFVGVARFSYVEWVKNKTQNSYFLRSITYFIKANKDVLAWVFGSEAIVLIALF